MIHPIQEILNVQHPMSPQDMSYWMIKYNYFKEFNKLEGQVKNKLGELYRKCKPKLSFTIPFIHAEWLDLGETCACVCPDLEIIILNPLHALYNPDYAIAVTVPHEYAHLLDYLDCLDVKKEWTRDHGKRWENACKMVAEGVLPAEHNLPSKDIIKAKLEERKCISAEDFVCLNNGDYYG